MNKNLWMRCNFDGDLLLLKYLIWTPQNPTLLCRIFSKYFIIKAHVISYEATYHPSKNNIRTNILKFLTFDLQCNTCRNWMCHESSFFTLISTIGTWTLFLWSYYNCENMKTNVETSGSDQLFKWSFIGVEARWWYHDTTITLINTF